MPSGVCVGRRYVRSARDQVSDQEHRHEKRRAHLVGLDVRAEPCTEGLCELVQLCAIARKDGAVDDEGGGPERIEVLALVLVDKVLLLGLATDVVGGAGLLGDERVGWGVFLCTHRGHAEGVGIVRVGGVGTYLRFADQEKGDGGECWMIGLRHESNVAEVIGLMLIWRRAFLFAYWNGPPFSGGAILSLWLRRPATPCACFPVGPSQMICHIFRYPSQV